MITDKNTARKNSDIEVLRAFAILFTLVLHFRVLLPAESIVLTPLAWLDLSVGVDLFLVISGYVITGSILASTQQPSSGRRALMFSFWVKRIFRLLPAAWTWVVIACLAQLVVSTYTSVQYDTQDILLGTAAAMTNMMNLYMPWCIADGDALACLTQNFVGHYWSLSLEEQFYLIFPLLFFFLRRNVLVGVLIAALALQFMWHRPFLTYAWYFKTDALCWGILLSLLSQTEFYKTHIPVLFRQRWLATTTGLALLIFLPVLAADIQGIGTAMQPYGVAVVALVCAAIVWLASYDRDVFSTGKRYNAVMLYLGSRSYSLYLSHLVVFLTIKDFFDEYGLGVAQGGGPVAVNALLITAGVGLSLLGAEMTYRLVESVLRARGRVIAARLLTREA